MRYSARRRRRSALAALPQLVEGVLADGLEIFVARLASREVRDDEGFVHEAGQQVEDAAFLDGAAGSNPGGGPRRPAAGKNRKPPQQRLLAFGQEVVAPVEQRPQGLVAWKGRAASPDEQEEAVVQAAREPLRRHHPQLRNGKLDRHRDAVEMLADVRDRRGVGVAQGEASICPRKTAEVTARDK